MTPSIGPVDLGRLAYETWQRERSVPGDARWDLMPATAQAAWRVTAQVVATAERERIYNLLGRDHYVVFTEDRWTVEHSVECRLSGQMPECAYHASVTRIAAEYDPDMLGRWLITGLDGEGLPSLERADA